MHYRLPHPGQGVLGHALAIYASQPTTLPSEFSTMLLQDPTWHMDIGRDGRVLTEKDQRIEAYTFLFRQKGEKEV
ncbi:hypothetical protein Tco_0878403 [Tanacetum coccineum]|uniref:Uncharacterized protein n=1 Tax=Tanacetum coccineum TaxID=301880 RepID=A0ABQ5C0R4_9ASTR